MSSTTSTTPHRCSISKPSATSIRASAVPTQAVLEQRVAALEGGTAALAVASGHAAQMIVFHTLMEPGDEFVAGRQLYGGSVNQFNHSFKKFNWNVAWADATDPETFAEGHHAQDQGDLLRVDRQSGRHRRRPAGHLGHRQESRRAADRRQHAGDALPVPAQGASAPTSSSTRSPSSWAATAIRSAASSSTAAPSTGWRPRRNTRRCRIPTPATTACGWPRPSATSPSPSPAA